ncbi:MAG: hypothetical protein CVU77_02295 [Elusimicrobia bacterium HGW-Elusimicrobia-1]|jgi:opacity protein-like surface antigen|nr:MAG: hypothetical protein CVU77_02295 [Elusimicrobia bacterium HGW-Elusimicrobia-1]
MKKNMIVAAVLTVALSTASFAGRPFLTEDAPVSDVGVVGVELGADYKTPISEVDSNFVFYGGILPSLELYLEVPYTGLGGGAPGKLEVFNVGSKYNLFKVGEEQILTLVFNIANLPKKWSSLSYGAAAAASKNIGFLTVHSNLGFSFLSGENNDYVFDGYIWGVAVEKSLSETLTLCGEVHSGSTLFDKAFDDNHVTGMGGVRWSLNQKLCLDFSVRLPLTSAAENRAEDGAPTEKAHYVVGLTYEF